MNKKLQVFVSSTYTDLKDECQTAVEVILDAGHIPAGRALSKAEKSQMKTIQKWIDKSDIYILILGGIYGPIEDVSGLSYIELEYDYALSKNIPVFAIILNDSFLFTKANKMGKDAILEKENTYKYNSFKYKVKSNIAYYVSNINQISSVILAQLNNMCNSSNYNLIRQTKNIVNNKNTFENIGSSVLIERPLNINNSKHQQASVFVIMPFSETWSDDTYNIIKEVCNNLGVSLNRADEILGSQYIYNDIITNIIKSDIIIADITIINANVFYELGYAHALKKNVILIRQPFGKVPFDIAQFRYIEYDLSYKKAKEFQNILTNTINIYKK